MMSGECCIVDMTSKIELCIPIKVPSPTHTTDLTSIFTLFLNYIIFTGQHRLFCSYFKRYKIQLLIVMSRVGAIGLATQVVGRAVLTCNQ